MNVHASVHGRRSVTIMAIALVLLLAWASAASAAPITDVNSLSNTTAAPGGTHRYFVWISNIGDQSTPDADEDFLADEPRTLEITLPDGITAASSQDLTATGWECPSLVPGDSVVTCTSSSISNPYESASRNGLLILTTDVAPSASGVLISSFTVSGGGAPPDSTVDVTTISSAPPEFGIDAFDGQVIASAAGDPFTQAGGHPYAASTALVFNTMTNPTPGKGPLWPVEATKDVLVDLPPGLVGNPQATGDARCTLNELANSEGVVAKPQCPPGSQVGEAKVFVTAGTTGNLLGNPLPVFNMVPPAGSPARFGFNVSGTVVTLDAALRSDSDYGLSVNVRNVSEGVAVAGTELMFWGVPADPVHDVVRACPGQLSPGEGGPACETEQPLRAFLRNPTECTAPGVGVETTVRVDSWADPGDFKSASFISHAPPTFPFPSDQWGPPLGTTGCDEVPFQPTFSGAPTDSAARAPSGFAFDLSLPQSDDPDRIGTGDLKKAVVTLPLGVRVSPPSAAGLGGCSPAQIGLDSRADAACPESSKIGTIRIETPLLDAPLSGSIFLAKPKDNPFGSLLSLYLVAKGPGLIVKLPGKVDADPVTGQLTATFDDNPQLPFELLHLEFKGGPRAALVNPPTCGIHTTRAELTSWSGATVVSESSFATSKDGNGAPCGASQFSPDFAAGGHSVAAGKSTKFDMRLTRSDEDEELRTLTVRMPRGLLAKVAGLPLCPDAQAEAGTCGEGSRIGDVLTGAGAGSNPFYLPGRVYLTEPYNGGPFGLSIVVPAVAGPFDLGTVVVRASVRIDKLTARLSVVSDPLPTILEGIPLQVRDVRVSIDRERFMINPTSCLEKQVEGTVTSTGGKTASVASRFQVGGCGKLKLRPRMKLIVGAKGRTQAGRSTPLIAKLTQTPGQANLKSVDVTLPLMINALLPVVTDACTIAQFEANDCERARTGRAVAVTPLLDKPLRGNAYFVKRASGRGLPNLVVALRGQVDFDLVGRVVIPASNRLSTRFDAVPDVPIESFTLRMATGENGAVGVAENLCSKAARRAEAQIEFRGQNGALVRSSQRLNIRGCKKAK